MINRIRRSLLAIGLSAASTICFAADDARPAETIRTAVMLEQSLAELHLITPLSYSPVYFQPYTDPALGSSALMGGLIGGVIGNMLAAQAAIEAAQTQADQFIAPLVQPLGAPGLHSLLRKGVAQGLGRHHMTMTGQVFSGKSEPTPELFSRIPGANRNARWLIVKKGAEAGGQYGIPVGISEDLRQIRVALKVEVWDGADRRPRMTSFQDVLYYSDVLPNAPSHLAMDALEKDGQALLREGVQQTMAEAMTLALSGAGRDVDVERDDRVDLANATGAYRMPGKLLSHDAGRALILTRGGTLVSLPVDLVLP